ELLEIITTMVRDDMTLIRSGLDTNAQQLGFLDGRLTEIKKEFSGLRQRVETLANNLLRYEQTLSHLLQEQAAGTRAADLVEQVKSGYTLSDEDRQWLEAPPVGREEM